MALADQVLARVHSHAEGFVFTAKDMLDLGSRAAIDQVLARLSNDHTIRRIDRGIYDIPKVHPRIGPLWPSADSVAQAVARQTDSHLKPSGPFAANALGLTTQVPAQVIFLTDGPSRSVQVGNLLVVIQHAGRVDMLLPDTMAGLAIVVLRFLGRDGVPSEVCWHLSSVLDATNKLLLRQVRKQLPGWLGVTVDELVRA